MIFKFCDCIAVLIARGLAQKKAQKIYSLYHCDGFSSDSACAQPSLKQRVPMKPVRTPVAILGSLGVCIYVPASRHWLISYSPVHLN